ncbi:MAG: diacylglycerol/lipid kinase family protein [Isosphaeraceae bacterium]
MTSPFGPLVVIVNPRCIRGRMEAKIPEIERILRDEGLGYRIVRTTHPGHATKAARDALQGGERYLVAVGGDGTVHEVVNGMLQDNEPIAANAVLGVVPAGSGCDFVKSFNLPRDTLRAARRLSGDSIRPIDVGKVTFTCGTAKLTQYFPNIAEVGLGGAVVARASRLPGFLPATVRIDADGQVFAWRAHNVVVANCR